MDRLSRFGRSVGRGLRAAGLGLVLAGIVLGGVWLAAPRALASGECIEGMYKYCDGDCPPEHTQQGECTTRLEQVGGTEVRWCCCDNDYRPEDAGGETTIGGPPTSIGQCPGSGEEDKPKTDPWAAEQAVRRTPDPGFTDSVLDLVRDNILKRNPKGKTYVDAVYRFAGPVDQILAKNPRLTADTASLMSENLTLLLRLANDLRVTVNSRKVDQAVGLLERYSKAAGDNAELKQAIARAQRDLKDRAFLQQLGITVKD